MTCQGPAEAPVTSSVIHLSTSPPQGFVLNHLYRHGSLHIHSHPSSSSSSSVKFAADASSLPWTTCSGKHSSSWSVQLLASGRQFRLKTLRVFLCMIHNYIWKHEKIWGCWLRMKMLLFLSFIFLIDSPAFDTLCSLRSCLLYIICSFSFMSLILECWQFPCGLLYQCNHTHAITTKTLYSTNIAVIL